MRRVLKILFSVLLAITIWRPVHVCAQTPSFIISLSETDTVTINLDAGERGAHVIFPCNKTYFDKNQESWVELTKSLQDIFEDSTLTLEAVHMYGAASPEGPYANNVYLSINRTRRVIDELRKNFPQLDSVSLSSYNVPEDYRRLAVVTENDSAYRDISKYFTGDDRTTKKNLQRNRATWNDLLKRYYPGLRAVNVLLYVREPRKTPAILVTDIPTVPVLPVNLEVCIPEIRYQPVTYCWRQPMVRLKTNLLYDVVTVPNLSLEFLPRSGHFTPEVKVMRACWRNDEIYKTLIIKAYEAGIRYYFKPDKYTGWFMNASMGTGVYDVQTSKNHGRLSKKYAYNNKFEVGGGYVKCLGDTGWTIEFTAGLGCIYSRFNKYHGAEDWATPGEFYYDWHAQPEEFRKYTHRFRWIGPVNVGITLSYDLIYYKKKCVSY